MSVWNRHGCIPGKRSKDVEVFSGCFNVGSAMLVFTVHSFLHVCDAHRSPPPVTPVKPDPPIPTTGKFDQNLSNFPFLDVFGGPF